VIEFVFSLFLSPSVAVSWIPPAQYSFVLGNLTFLIVLAPFFISLYCPKIAHKFVEMDAGVKFGYMPFFENSCEISLMEAT
jgi:hypothetical protein